MCKCLHLRNAVALYSSSTALYKLFHKLFEQKNSTNMPTKYIKIYVYLKIGSIGLNKIFITANSAAINAKIAATPKNTTVDSHTPVSIHFFATFS